MAVGQRELPASRLRNSAPMVNRSLLASFMVDLLPGTALNMGSPITPRIWKRN